MFGVANIIYLVVGIVSAVLGLVLFKLVGARANRSNYVVSQAVGHAAIFAILTLWSVALVAFATAFDLNPNLLSH